MEQAQSAVAGVEIHRSRRHLVLRVDDGSGRSRIRKTVRARSMSGNAAARLRHEYAMLRVLTDSAVLRVPRPVALEDSGSGPTLVLEDAGPHNLGERLRQRALPTDLFLDMAIQLAEIIATLHQQRVIHRDINPSNVVVGADGRSLTLVDFGLATHVVAMARPAAVGELAGTLPYVAPEQTGRVDRAMDHRADLYSLGATLYEMATGSPPFQTDDPAELVHAHLAVSPSPPRSRNPAVPQVLSEIVLRLLAKMPEQRYQSSEALLADLREAQRQWHSGHTILPFEIGRLDIAQSLLAPAGLHGRAAELELLTAAVERVRGGAGELLSLSGPPGIGKSRLVQALRAAAEPLALFVSGKSDPLQMNLPYAALAEPVRAFLRDLLRQPAQLIEGWRVRLAEALGANVGVVGDLIPELRLLLGETPLPPAVGPVASENRVRLTLQALVQALASRERPLVLVLDDVQWADAASLAVVERLATTEARHLLVLAVSRSDELAGPGPAPRLIQATREAGTTAAALTLQPLDLRAIEALCAEALRCPPERVRPLAELALRKTAGNPFFAERFLRLLQRSTLLTFDERTGGWSWDLAGAERLAITDNVVDLMVGALGRLPSETGRLLAMAACMRSQVPLWLLAEVAGLPVGEAARGLWAVLRDGLLVPERGAGEGAATAAEDHEDAGVGRARYRFVHDRIRQAAYSLLSEADKQRSHLAIGRCLLARSQGALSDEDLFDMVDQLARGVALMTAVDERLRLAELSLQAAERARTSGSPGAALEYARRGIAALPEQTRSEQRRLWLALHRLAAECAFVSGDAAAGVGLFTAGLDHAVSAVEKAELHAVRVQGESIRGGWQEAAAWGRRGLALLGRPLPDDLTAEVVAGEVAALRGRLGDRPIADLAELPPMRDPEALVAIELIRRMALTANLWDERLWSILIVRLLAISLEHGNAPTSAWGYVGFGIYLLDAPGEAATSAAFGKVGIDLARRLRDPTTESWVLTTFAVQLNHWQAPLRSNVPVLRRAVQSALENGEFQIAGFAVAALVSHLFHSGAELAQVESEAAAGMRVLQKTGQQALLPLLRPYAAVVAALQVPRRERPAGGGGPEQPGRAVAAVSATLLSDHPMTLVAPCILRDRPELARRFQNKRQLFQFSAGLRSTVAAPWFTFYAGLAAGALHDEADAEDRPILREIMAQNRQALATWAERGPDNYRHRADLLAAELARVDGHVVEALGLFDRAIEGAWRQQFPHDEAMAYELAGRCRLSPGLQQTAQRYLQGARAAFARWGAAAKVDALDEEFPELEAVSGSHPQAASSSDEAGVAALDLHSLMKATETLAAEVVLDRLLEKLIAVCLEVAGARSGALVLAQGSGDGRLQVRARGAVAEPVALEQTSLGASLGLPRTLVEYVFSRGEAVVLGDASRQGDFTADPYFAGGGVKSALAMPLVRQGRSLGVLYLENDLATHGFPAERVRVLGLLSSQIAIALENGRLFEDLKVEVGSRTRAEQAVRFLAEASATLAESLDYRTTLTEVARLAVPFLADWCTVDVVETGGGLTPVAAVHTDPARQRTLDELRRAFPVVSSERMPAAQALRTRAPVLIAEVSETRMAAAIPDPRHLEQVQALGARSVVAVPLVARGRALGAITLGIAFSSRRYDAADVALAQELARRAAIAVDNARLYQDAQEAVRLRDEFLTVASHELNTPITTLRLSVGSMTDDTRLPDQAIPGMLANVGRQSERLSRLVGEMLDVARIQAGELQPRLEPVDLGALIRDVTARLSESLARARCPLTLDLEASVVGRWDRSALDRVLGNMLANAIKFGPGKPIEVTLRTEPGSARLTVRDHGIGIDPVQLPRIFDRFARGVSVTNYGGLGLGLYIAQAMVQSLGGTITVDSTPGQGATFTVALPR